MASFSRFAALAALVVMVALAAPSDAGMLNAGIYDVNEGSKVMSGSAQADLALIGRRAVLESQGYTEDEIQKELKILEQKVSGWRNKVHTLPPDLNAVMTDAERAEVGPVGDMTYGELENLVTKLSERLQANEHAYIEDVEAAAANGTIVEGVAEDSWKIDERMMARQHGATEADMPEKSLHDLHVESVMSGEIVESMGGKKSYSKLNKNEKLNEETTQEQGGYGRFNSLRSHPLHPKSEEEAKKRQTLQVPSNCATGVEDAPVASTCDAKIHEEIQTAKDNGIDVNYGHISEAQMRKQELDLLNEIQDFAKNKDYKRENPNYVEL